MNAMRTNLLAAALLATGLLSASCEMVTCVKGTGDAVKKDLSIAAFTGIDLTGALDVKFTRAAQQKVTVEGQANLIDLIETSVSNGVWTIKTRECYSTDKPFVVHISAPVIDRVHLQGSGDVSSADAFEAEVIDLAVQGSGDIKMNFTAKQIVATVQGSGDITLQGSTSELTCTIQGSGDVKAADLKTDRTKATITGSGDVSVTASMSIDAKITGSGDVKYRGNPPEVKSHVTGSGEVAPMK